jgi:tetratricopeptide (TPR) repeat protein
VDRASGIRPAPDDPAELALGLWLHGAVLRIHGNLSEASRVLGRAIEVARQAGAARPLAEALAELGNAEHFAGSFEEAERLHREALAVWDEAGDLWGQGRALGSLAMVHQEQGRLEEPLLEHERSLHALHAANRVYVAVSTLRSLGLRDVVLSGGDGYLIDPEVDIA